VPAKKKPERIIKSVSCLGFADAYPRDQVYQDAFNVGKILAQNGYVVADGGGPGAMRAATEGAESVGGETVGVTFYPKDITNFEGRDMNNKFDKEIVTKNYLERTLKLLEVGQAYVIFKGGVGTISEFGMAWELASLYQGHAKPLILYGKFWEKIMVAMVSQMIMRPENLQVYRIVDSPEEVIAALELFDTAMRNDGNHDGGIHEFSDDEKAFQV
jgi:uncharacterized protein (TIGR00730 family)